MAAVLAGATLLAAAGTVPAQAPPAAAATAAAAAPAAAPAAPAADSAPPAANAGYARPTGPITITADSAELKREGLMIYSGRVTVSSKDFELKGARVEVRQLENKQYEVKVGGSPATFVHHGAGPEAPPVDADAREILYSSATAMADLAGDVRLERGEQLLTGETLHYDLAARRIQVSGGEGGQVRIVMPPPEDIGGTPPRTPPRP